MSFIDFLYTLLFWTMTLLLSYRIGWLQGKYIALKTGKNPSIPCLPDRQELRATSGAACQAERSRSPKSKNT